jgi:hypothetical protein
MIREKASVDLKYTVKGIDTLGKGAIGITGINQALEVTKKVAEAAQAALRMFTNATMAVVDTGSMFEKYTIQFQTLLGSADAGLTRMEDLFRFASTTPFELPGVVEAARTMENFGIYTERAMRAAGDAAALMDKDFTEAALAIANATTGEMEMLKQYGITSTTIAAQMGHAVSRETQADLDDIGEAVIELFEQKFGGGMEKMRGTWAVTMSNLEDRWTEFKKMVADAEVFETMKGIFQAILATVDELFASGKGEQAAQLIGKAVSDLLIDAAIAMTEAGKYLYVLAKDVRAWLQDKGLEKATEDIGIRAKGAGVGAVVGGVGLGLLTRSPFGVKAGIAGGAAGGAAVAPWVAEALGQAGGYQFSPRYAYSEMATAGRLAGRAGGGDVVEAAAEVNDIYLNTADALINRLRELQEPFIGPMPGAAEAAPEIGAREQAGFRQLVGFDDEFKEAHVEDLLELTEADIEAANAVLEAWERTQDAMMSGYSRMYSYTHDLGEKWRKGEKVGMKDMLGAYGEFARGTLAAFIEGKAQEWGLKATESGVDAIKALARYDFGAAAGHAAAAAGYIALGGAAGVVAGAISAPSGSGGGGGSAGYEGSGADASEEPGGTRHIDRGAGVRAQNLTVNVWIVHQGGTVYGQQGIEEMVQEEMIPAIEDAVMIGTF